MKRKKRPTNFGIPAEVFVEAWCQAAKKGKGVEGVYENLKKFSDANGLPTMDRKNISSRARHMRQNAVPTLPKMPHVQNGQKLDRKALKAIVEHIIK